MKYTRNNIDGIKFRVNGYGVIYTIEIRPSRRIKIKWGEGDGYVEYNDFEVIDSLNDGDWIPINKNEPIKIINSYEIY